MRRTCSLAALALLLAPPAAAEVLHFEGGRLAERIDGQQATARGLTIVDLSDDWTPSVFTPEIGYRRTLISLANKMAGASGVFRHAREDHYYELFGVFPSLAVVRARLADEPRHLCHDEVDDDALAVVILPLTRNDALARAAIRGAQGHLACDGLLAADDVDGKMGPRTRAALAAYRLRHMIPSGRGLDEQTRTLLVEDSRELDFRALLRALRERVVDATGLIEDGSARGVWGQVLGRDLDAPQLHDTDGWPWLENAAPDLISPATEAAARALGWTSPEAALAFFARLPDTGAMRVALALPPEPAYHGPFMALRAEIDRGDVFTSRAHRFRRSPRRPALMLYAQTAEGELALVRWPTTIGGWQKEKLASGRVVLRYKASKPGDYVWRDIVVAPAWFPPPSTPDRELLRRTATGWRANQDVIGPGYRSAYGLVMIMHHLPVTLRSGAIAYEDTGVRTHGSVNYRSIQGGHSHGCHRLFNHLALRLAAFVLRHRPHQALGEIDEVYDRRLRAGGRVLRIHRESRGFGFRLDAPIPIRVLVGCVRP